MPPFRDSMTHRPRPGRAKEQEEEQKKEAADHN
jgi:hypothetical protein